MVGLLDRNYVETLPVPTLLRRLAVIRRVDARRRYEAFSEALVAARGTQEGVESVTDLLGEAAGLKAPEANGWGGLARWLGGGG